MRSGIRTGSAIGASSATASSRPAPSGGAMRALSAARRRSRSRSAGTASNTHRTSSTRCRPRCAGPSKRARAGSADAGLRDAAGLISAGSVAQAEDALLGRARPRGPCARLGLLGGAVADLFGGGRVVGPAWTELGQAQIDLAPLRMAFGLQLGEVLAQRSGKARERADRVLHVVVVGDRKSTRLN